MPSKLFEKGNQTAKGNKGGTGRPPDWIRDKIDEIVDWDKKIQFLNNVVDGKPVDRFYSAQGKRTNLLLPAGIRERIRALEILLERRWGKAPQDIKVGADEGVDLVSLVIKNRKERGIPWENRL